MRADDQDKSAPAPEPVRKLADKAFLGPEFLTWLYFTLLEEGFEIALPGAFTDRGSAPDDDLVRFAIGKRVQLQAVEADGAKVALNGPGLDDNGEILQAIRRGALVTTLQLEAAIDSRVYGFTLNGQDGGLTGVKLPDLFSEPDDENAVIDPLTKPKAKRRPRLPLEDVLALRMQCLDELEAVVDALFQRFITRRLARAWVSEDVAQIRAHVVKGLKRRLAEQKGASA